MNKTSEEDSDFKRTGKSIDAGMVIYLVIH